MKNKITININNEKANRFKKLERIKAASISAYTDKYEKQILCQDVKNLPMGTKIKTAGRIVLLREMGKIIFVHLYDFSGRIQIVLKHGEINNAKYELFIKIVDIGDFVGVEGEVFTTKKGEISILVKDYTFLGKALRPLPEKWHGLKDVEKKYRKRYLDLIMNEETRKVFKFRSDFIWELRMFYRENGFHEVDTPVLCNNASGALAKPFITHHNALGVDVFLRIAPEIYLKEAIIGGYDKIFEVARSFRNEGMDSSHLQDFTMVEHYSAYWNFKDNMVFTEKMLTTIIKKLLGSLQFEILNRKAELVKVDFTAPWKTVSFRELLIADCGIDIDKCLTVEKLREEIMKKGVKIDDLEKLGRGNLIDSLYKAVSRPKIIDPTFLINHPIDLSPLARKNDANPLTVDRFQLVVNGWEIINAYSELIDPVDQKERFEKQMEIRATGDEEAMLKDDEYVEAMEYGMPPMSGWGMGVERIVALLTKQSNLRDVVLFPLMKPELGSAKACAEE
ncbi:lysine--tRNA ligase [Patescibacteria group bacterium]|nr:lysine--tRNA ligase [Patescibacteria group bacterium]MBU1663712.1 lysine--tRNA ligase [Patescibacteria group bacterium]MBU1934266.1 lysine--tRNA ligase [Patescibacteria group bacterium]MBU2007723.1 lysine--tRNA ligase [Patescibacteria group bacterium]MBU2233576.1 lysine--tRNA ligase [Patescibacteria group bacterium]